MSFKNVYIPYGQYFTTPFCRWQGSFQNLHSIKFAAETTTKFLGENKISPKEFDQIILGLTIPQLNCFYGGPWLASLIGAEQTTGPIISQACATGTNSVSIAAQNIETRINKNVFVLCTDRCSNGPHLAYPNPLAPGSTLDSENWVWDNFGYDPYAKNSMIETGENVAKEEGITKEEQDNVTLMRYNQYQDSLKNDRAFQKKYMISPVEVKDRSGRKVLATVEGDEGVYLTTMEGLTKLRPVLPGGTITYGTQTHPADGNSGIIVTTQEKANEFRTRDDVEVKVVSYGDYKTKKGYMAMAIVPAAKTALERAGISITDVSVIKTHNPFAVNDIFFSREMDVDLKDMNNYGSSLIFGHPQAPTMLRIIIEMIEELVEKGGGYGLADGCAAGDTGAALVLKVTID
ncbi:MAG: thiolase family protein [Promethearchaeota archaeon]|jgi:acetyl-CoA acetyltransferase family protein